MPEKVPGKVYGVANSYCVGTDQIVPLLAERIPARVEELLNPKNPISPFVESLQGSRLAAVRAVSYNLNALFTARRAAIHRRTSNVLVNFGKPGEVERYHGAPLVGALPMGLSALRDLIDGVVYLEGGREQDKLIGGYVHFFEGRIMRVPTKGRSNDEIVEDIMRRLPEFPNRSQ